MVFGGQGWPRTDGRGCGLRHAAAIGAVVAVAGLGAGEATAHSPEASSLDPTVLGEEAALIGPEHAAEHARIYAREQRALARWRQLSPAKRHRLRRAAARTARAQARASAQAAAPAATVGRWTVAPFGIPNYAIHAAMLPTGKVMFWGYPPLNPDGTRPLYGQAALWDPSQGTGAASMKVIPPPTIDADHNPNTPPVPAPIYCSGQSLLPNGQLLMMGGTIAWPNQTPGYTGFAGLERVFTFDPWTETWTEQPSMAAGRWYPSQVELADGRTIVVGGYTEDAPGSVITNLVEEYRPAAARGGQGSVGLLNGANRVTDLYPRLHLMPNGNVFMAGPGRWHIATLTSTQPGSGSWTDMSGFAAMAEPHWSGNSVLLPGGPNGSWQVDSIGGVGAEQGPDGAYHGTTTVETLDYANAGAGWSRDPSLQVPRAHQNTVELPNGAMVEIGGGLGEGANQGNWATTADKAQRQVEVFDPATRTWTLGPAQVEDRTYHSTALLLPDGRVWSAGDDKNPFVNGVPSRTDTAEIYRPPYLFAGSRPRTQTFPRALRWADEFNVSYDTAEQYAQPTKAVLMAPSAVTHGDDMNQRRVQLQVVSVGGGTMRLKSPPTPAVAPPGYYMLFLLSNQGVPSVARWVRLNASAPDAP
jgi:Galactose oxidase-like, Early set domain/Glyoxal oxidase N-terminus